MAQQKFQVKTPMGIIEAIESPDKDNPGIVLLYIDKDGKEHSSCLMQYLTGLTSEDEGKTIARIFGPDDPDGEPVITMTMD